MLGWYMLERNLTVGGLFGYDSSKLSTRRKVPSSNGVSAGPTVGSGGQRRGGEIRRRGARGATHRR